MNQQLRDQGSNLLNLDGDTSKLADDLPEPFDPKKL